MLNRRTNRVGRGMRRTARLLLGATLLAGAGIKCGQAVGASTADGEHVKDRPVKREDQRERRGPSLDTVEVDD